MLRTLPFIGFFMGCIGVGMFFRNHQSGSVNQEIGKWFAAGGIFLYLLFFAIGMGPTPWTVNSEIYPLHLRGIGNSMSSTTNWISNFVVAMSFLVLLEDISFGDVIAFMLILAFTILAFIFVYFIVYETKGLPMEKIISLFVKERNTDALKSP